jgi:hypothetical protein
MHVYNTIIVLKEILPVLPLAAVCDNLPKESPVTLLHHHLTVYQLLVHVLHVAGPKRNSATMHLMCIISEPKLN